MRHKSIAMLVVLLLSFAAAQQKPSTTTAKAKTTSSSAKPEHASSATKLPTEDEVNGFLQQTFGYDPQLTWKIASIKPSPVEGLAEVNVLISGPQGQGAQKFFVSKDGKHAVIGEIIPFGNHPFEEARLQLQKKVNGP